MHASVQWLNQYLAPSDVTAEEASDVLMNLGFPIETREDLAPADGGPDVRLDVEVTSNRGDCLSQVGLAREIAARTGRRFVAPAVRTPAAKGGPVAAALTLENRHHDACPLFTARVIRGVKVGPSPAWLVRALAAVGQRSINNVVDVTNFLCFELGNPSHVFDLAKLAGRKLIVRYANAGEKLLTLDGKTRVLKADELVVADAERAQSLAGVIGGGESEVSAGTTDVVLEVATWDPVTVRRAARRLAVRTDASYRFERTVDARTLQGASDRAAALLLEVAGGDLCEGTLTAGGPPPQTRTIDLRLDRCRAVLGYVVEDGRARDLLEAQGLAPTPAGPGVLRCTVPPTRVDLVREIDLIEEVARTNGLAAIPVADRLAVAVRPPQESQRGLREVGATLTGLGFFETVTFSFVRPADGKAWTAPDLEIIGVDDERRGAEPTLRPSLIPSLLACRKANQDGQVRTPGLAGVRLFEVASVFGQAGGRGVERRNIGLLADVRLTGKTAGVDDLEAGLRTVRGAVEALARQLGGPAGTVSVEKSAPHGAALLPSAYGAVLVAGRRVGYVGVVSPQAAQACGLEGVYACAEVGLEELLALFPPRSRVEGLPTFPAVERDLSPVVAESMTWDAVRGVVQSAALPRLESVEFVGTYRGKQAGPGRKSLTLRLRFRDPSKTLRHEEVDAEVSTVVGLLNARCGAAWRTA